MEMGLVTILLWGILNFLPSSDAVACSEIAQCEYDTQSYDNAQATADMTTLCNLLGKSVDCMQIAMDDCQRHSSFPDHKLQQAQQVLEMHRKQVLSHCPHLDESFAKTSESDNEGPVSAQKKRDFADINDIPESPSCPDIANCKFDQELFNVAIKENRLTEACGLIKPSVRCLRMAISDCKKSKLFDNDDLSRAAHSVMAAESLFENHCRYSEEKENIKAHTSIAESEGEKHEEQGRNQSVAATRATEKLDGNKTNDRRPASNNNTVSENTVNDGKGIHDKSSPTKHANGNAASIQMLSLRFIVLLLLLSI